jgi:hypothetical protein
MTEEIKFYLIFIIVLVIGFAISFFLYHKLRMRIPGVIAAPLLAVYSIQNLWILPIIIVVSIIIFIILHVLYIRFFLYGRRLFLLGCIFSIVLSAIPLIMLGMTDVIILTVLPAIFAYNTVINVERRALSLGLLVGDLVVLIVIGWVLTLVI